MNQKDKLTEATMRALQGKLIENKSIKTEGDLKFKVNDIVEDATGIGKILEIDTENPDGLVYGVLFMNNDLPYDYDDIGSQWCKEDTLLPVTDTDKIKQYTDWYKDYMTNASGKFYYEKPNKRVESKSIKTEAKKLMTQKITSHLF